MQKKNQKRIWVEKKYFFYFYYKKIQDMDVKIIEAFRQLLQILSNRFKMTIFFKFNWVKSRKNG